MQNGKIWYCTTYSSRFSVFFLRRCCDRVVGDVEDTVPEDAEVGDAEEEGRDDREVGDAEDEGVDDDEGADD